MYNPLQYLLAGRFQPTVDNNPTLGEGMTQGQNRQIAAQQAQDAAIAAEQQQRFNEQTMGSRVQQQGNIATQGGLNNQALQLGMPARQVEAQQAGVESNYLNQMFPGLMNREPGANLPPGLPMSRESDAQNQPTQNQFQGKSLNDLRQMKADAGPMGAFLGKFIDPVIQRRSDVEEVQPALAEISTVAAMPGGSKEAARLKRAALSAVVAKYPMVAADPRIKEAIATAAPKDADFNPAAMMGVESRLVGPLLTDWRSSREKYETQYGQPFLQIQGIKNSKAYGTSLGDQSMIDKLIIMETGKPPTEAQYANLSQKIGFSDMFDIAAGKFASGQQLSAPMRKSLESEIEEQARIGHQAYVENMAQAKDQAQRLGLDPEAVIRPGGSYGQVDSHMKSNPGHSAPSGEPRKIANKAEYDALPSGTVYVGPSGKKAKKP